MDEFHHTSIKSQLMTLFENKKKENLIEKLDIKCFYCNEQHFIKDCTTFIKCDKLVFICKNIFM
jgi:hypothetical protein